MEWSTDKILEFIGLYEKRRLLWDPKHREHKNRNRLNDAWTEIQKEFNPHVSITDFKKKKESLLSTYRLLRKKVTDRETTGQGPDDLQKPGWFAYNALDRFLGGKATKNPSINSEGGGARERYLEEDERITDDPTIQNSELHVANTLPSAEEPQTATLTGGSCTPPLASKKRKQPTSAIVMVSKQLQQASRALQSISERQACKQQDACALYGQLLAERLRGLNPRARLLVQNKIDNLLYEALLLEMDRSSAST